MIALLKIEQLKYNIKKLITGLQDYSVLPYQVVGIVNELILASNKLIEGNDTQRCMQF